MQTEYIKNTVFIFVGESHTDPAPVGLIKHYIEKFHQAGIPQVFCAELPHNESLKEKQNIETIKAKENEMLLPLFSSFSKRNSSLAFPYFSANQIKPFSEILSLKYDRPKKICDNSSLRVVCYINNLENLQVSQLLSNLQIPYQGIEQTTSEYDNLAHKFNEARNSNSTKEVITTTEKCRIEDMIQRLFEKSLPLLKENHGIVWVNGGALHIHNLAVAALNYIQKNSLTAKCSFTLLPIDCYSAYFEGVTKKALLSDISKARSAFEQTECYPLFDKIPFHIVENVEEEKKHHYKSKRFDELMEFAKDSFQKTNVFHVPAWNSEKQQTVMDLHGVVQMIEGDSATISIASEALQQPVRDLLDIDRRKLTFTKGFAEKRKQLEKQPAITVEPLPNPTQLLVTFPLPQLDFVESVVKGKSS